MAINDLTTVNTPTSGTPVSVMSDARTVTVLSNNTEAKVFYNALIDGTPDSANFAVVNSAGALKVDPSGVTSPVSASSLPLPAGASTASAQSTAQTTLNSILAGVTDTTPVAVTQAASSQADGHSVTIGAQGDTTWGGSAAASAMSIFRYIGVKLEAIRALLAATINTTVPTATPIVVQFTRPANTTAYAVGQVIGTASTSLITLASLSRNINSLAWIGAAKLNTSQSTCQAQVRAHLFSGTPSAAASPVDASVMKYLIADRTLYQGYIDLPSLNTADATSTFAWCGDAYVKECATDSSGNGYVVLETRTVFTPASAQTFELHIVPSNKG